MAKYQDQLTEIRESLSGVSSPGTTLAVDKICDMLKDIQQRLAIVEMTVEAWSADDESDEDE